MSKLVKKHDSAEYMDTLKYESALMDPAKIVNTSNH